MSKERVVFLHLADYVFPIWRVHIMAEELSKAGYDVHVVCVRGDAPRREVINGVTVWNLSKFIRAPTGGISPKTILKYINIVEKITIDLKPKVIQVFHPLMIPLGVRLKRKTKAKLVYDCYEPWIHGALADKHIHSAVLYYIIHQLFKHEIDGAIFVYMGNPIVRYFPKSTIKIWFPNLPKELVKAKEITRNDHLLGNSPNFIVGYLGVVTKYKGYETAIRAMSHLDEAYKLLIIGAFQNNSVKTKLYKLAKELKVLNRIQFTGKLGDFREVYKYVRKIKIGLMIPDDTYWQRYTLPVKLFDYISLGIPIIASDLPNFRKFIEEYKIGAVLVPPSDSKGLAKTIATLKESPRQLKTMKKLNLLAYKKYFRLECFSKRLLTMYNLLINQ